MTPEEYNKKHKELLDKIPEEFRGWLSWYSYDKGHSAGYEEVLLVLDDMVRGFLEPLNNYKKAHGIK